MPFHLKIKETSKKPAYRLPHLFQSLAVTSFVIASKARQSYFRGTIKKIIVL